MHQNLYFLVASRRDDNGGKRILGTPKRIHVDTEIAMQHITDDRTRLIRRDEHLTRDVATFHTRDSLLNDNDRKEHGAIRITVAARFTMAAIRDDIAILEVCMSIVEEGLPTAAELPANHINFYQLLEIYVI